MQVSTWPSTVAVILVVPFPTHLTTPVSLIEATLGFSLAHTTGLYSYPKRPKTGNQNLDIRDGGR